MRLPTTRELSEKCADKPWPRASMLPRAECSYCGSGGLKKRTLKAVGLWTDFPEMSNRQSFWTTKSISTATELNTSFISKLAKKSPCGGYSKGPDRFTREAMNCMIRQSELKAGWRFIKREKKKS